MSLPRVAVLAPNGAALRKTPDSELRRGSGLRLCRAARRPRRARSHVAQLAQEHAGDRRAGRAGGPSAYPSEEGRMVGALYLETITRASRAASVTSRASPR
jgi:hypothetical protein